MTDKEGLISLLQDCGPLAPLPEQVAPTVREPSELDEERDWQEDPVTGKWNKIRSEFMNGKTADEVRAMAESMSGLTWLEMCTKMAPKQVEVNTMQITAIRIELPPEEMTEATYVSIQTPIVDGVESM